jgi:hypothetical protein
MIVVATLSLCTYKELRRGILQALFCAITADAVGVCNAVVSLDAASHVSENHDLEDILKFGRSRLMNPLALRRFISTIGYLIKKSGKSIWSEIITRNTHVCDSMPSSITVSYQ